jgi:hypothetical protein
VCADRRCLSVVPGSMSRMGDDTCGAGVLIRRPRGSGIIVVDTCCMSPRANRHEATLPNSRLPIWPPSPCGGPDRQTCSRPGD